jgi:hypothetical protein
MPEDRTISPSPRAGSAEESKTGQPSHVTGTGEPQPPEHKDMPPLPDPSEVGEAG